ncbi:MAG: PrsW family intramembrane metalloprotease [Candidatus Campbellbacteria bacterium]|nr:PrsW family intramembrane metalloprotease [Candidatus Campbellbacteria bacterium]
MPIFQSVVIAFLGGSIPAFFWLWFWLREDRKHPEPRHLLVACFFLGMAGVVVAIPLEKAAELISTAPLFIFIVWALIEESLKYGAAYIGGMHTQAEDEPIDAMVYLLTAALGFAAAENMLFLLNPLIEGDAFVGILTGNIRFIGTSLLHVVASCVIGGMVALSFYKKKKIRHEYFLAGLIGAVALHTAFNYFIVQGGAGGLFYVFAMLWILVIGLMLLFEDVKRVHPQGVV